MHMSHSLVQCPLYNCATLTLDTDTRIITHASSDMMQLLDGDLTGTTWPSKQDQQLCFTTLVKLQHSQRYKRLLTCEHINDKDPAITTIHCAELSKLDTTSAFFYALAPPMSSPFSIESNMSTIILRMSPYGVIQSAFISPTTHTSHTSTPSWMIGQPLMRFIHNHDIPILCGGLRQVTKCQQGKNTSNRNGGSEEWYDKDDLTMASFDVRCNFDDRCHQLQHNSSMDGDDNKSINRDRLYHFSTTVTGSQDILCVIRPALFTTNDSNVVSSQDIQTQTLSPDFQPSSFASSRTWRIPRTTPRTRSPPTSSSGHGAPRVYSALIRLSQLVRSPYSKGKDMVSGLQQALWDALEQGWMMLAHYLAVVVVLALQYYRMARYPSFWLETSELALRCLVAETTSRHELDCLLSWLDRSAAHQQPWLDSALDHGSEWLFSLSLRSQVYSF